MPGKVPLPADELWVRPRWSRDGRVGRWHLLAAGQRMPGGRAVCGYKQWYTQTGYETTIRGNLYDQQVCIRCSAALGLSLMR